MTNFLHSADFVELKNSLLKKPRRIPSKYFYDKRGSELFEKICKLEEYYPKRTEISIMLKNIDEISSYFNENTIFIELGAGSLDKTKIILNNIKNILAYLPVDISGEFLISAIKNLKSTFPDLNVIPVITDYTKKLSLPLNNFENYNLIFYYPGSTIGNFTIDEAQKFLEMIFNFCNKGDKLLIGIDLVKQTDILLKAYNDSKGVTAEFNLNILNHVNRILEANFNTEYFYHDAIFNKFKNRIEMYLISKKRHFVKIQNQTILIEKGERILTEYSHKYLHEDFKKLVSPFFNVENSWEDEKNYFSLKLLDVKK